MLKYLMCGTAALALSAGTVAAGGMAPVAVEPAAVAADASASSSQDYIPLLMFLAFLALASATPAPSPSDIRLKTDIRRIGTGPLGLPVYRYRYAGLPRVFEGVMAQDVAMVRPDAVTRTVAGLMAVDYARLGMELRAVA
jgi:hypothetical protein